MWAIVTVTKNGVQRAIEVREACKSKISIDVYTIKKYQVESVLAPTDELKELISEVYPKYETILFIMASGIVVRMISPLIQSKLVDPAILVMDDKGENVISLLSGHIGGANEKAKYLAQIIGARPILTTSSDVNDKIAVDSFAMRNKLFITDFVAAKELTASILNGDLICIVNEVDIHIQDEDLCENLRIDRLDNVRNYKGAIIITQSRDFQLELPYIRLIPQDIVLGVGCKRDTKASDIIDFINHTMEKLKLDVHAIRTLATVDLKQDEVGLLEAREYFGVGLDIISREEIAKHQDKFKQSPFVMKTIGVGNVCEPCGYLSSKRGTCLLDRTAFHGITLSVWKEKKEDLL